MFWLILFGIIAGVVGGMGMGGGTVLVPLLSFTELSQHAIQAINLISFLPMASVAIFFHSQNRLLMPQRTPYMIIPAVLFAVLGSILTHVVPHELLRKLFGVMLICLGAWQLYVSAFTKPAAA